MLVSLNGQVVVIVGASSGTGRAAAVLFAREGAKVVAAARREDRLRSLKDELAREQRDITVRRADASSVEDMQQLAQATLEKFGRIDIHPGNMERAHRYKSQWSLLRHACNFALHA